MKQTIRQLFYLINSKLKLQLNIPLGLLQNRSFMTGSLYFCTSVQLAILIEYQVGNALLPHPYWVANPRYFKTNSQILNIISS